MLIKSISFVIISGLGGFLLSLTGISIGWMIGTLLTATFFCILSPKSIGRSIPQKGIPKYWLAIGQCILGIELGLKMNGSVLSIFQDNWLTISTMLLLSIFFSLLSGLVLWKFSKLDMLTSFFATAPGGLSSMPSIAEEVGANTGIVSIVQTMRIFLVILTVPVILSFGISNPIDTVNDHTASSCSTIRSESNYLDSPVSDYSMVRLLFRKIFKISRSLVDRKYGKCCDYAVFQFYRYWIQSVILVAFRIYRYITNSHWCKYRLSNS